MAALRSSLRRMSMEEATRVALADADLLLSTSNALAGAAALASAAKREYESSTLSSSPIAKVSRTAGGATHFTLPVMANPSASALNAVQAAFMAAPVASSAVLGPAVATGSAATMPIYSAVVQQPGVPPALVPKPRGPAPAGYTWESARGVWVDAAGKVREAKRSAAARPRVVAATSSHGPVIADAFVSSSSPAFPMMMAPGLMPGQYEVPTMHQWMPSANSGTCAGTTSTGASTGISAGDSGVPVRVVCRGCGLVRMDVEGRRWVHNHRQGKGNKQFVCNRVLCDCEKGTICPNKGMPHDPGMQPVEQLICPPVGCSSSQQEDLTYGSLSAIERGIHKHGVQSCADSTSSADAIVDSAGDYPSTMTTVLPEPLGAQTHVVAALPMGQPTEDEQESLPMAEAVPAYERTIVAPPTKRSMQEASVAAAMAAAATAAAAAVVARAEAVIATPQENVEA